MISFINHSKKTNVLKITSESYYYVTFIVAKQDIPAGDQIFIDYAIDTENEERRAILKKFGITEEWKKYKNEKKIQ